MTAVDQVAEGYLHQLGIYASDEAFRALICPFAESGLEAGEPVFFAYDDYKTELLRSWLPDAPGITYITDAGPYAIPARALAGWRQLVEGRLATGASRVRIAGNVPHPGYGRSYAGWDRYEAALDRALGDLPIWAPCLYDARIAPAEVLEIAHRHHRFLLDDDGTQRANDNFEHPAGLADFLDPPAEPLELAAPELELVDPTPRTVRAAVSELTEGLGSDEQHDDLGLACSEAVANALVHGEPPVRVRVWVTADRAVITVHDEGRGPTDPLVGLVPSGGDDAESGRGLWLAHQLDLDVALLAGGDGFSVRLTAEFPAPVG